MTTRQAGSPVGFAIFVIFAVVMIMFKDWVLAHQIIFFVIAGLLIIFFVLRPLLSGISSIKNLSQSGYQISEKIWDVQPNHPVAIGEIWPTIAPMVAIVGQGAPQSSLTVVPSVVATGNFDSVHYSVIQLIFSGFPRLAQVRLTFSGTFPGKLLLGPKSGPAIGHDPKLESIEFNSRVLVYGKSVQDAFKILSPDLMAWYLDVKQKPHILFEGQHCFISFIELAQPQTETISLSQRLAKLVLSSGALS